MDFDRRLSRLEMTLGKCAICDGKPRVGLVDETGDDGSQVSNTVKWSDPETCVYCGRTRDAVVIRIVNEHDPTCIHDQ